MLVMKFGGTSVGDPAAFRRVAGIVSSRVPGRPSVVVSAVAKTTDELVRLAQAAAAGDRQVVEGLLEWISQKHARIAAELQVGDTPAWDRAMAEAWTALRRVTASIEAAGDATRELADECVSWGEYLSSKLLVEFLLSLGIPAVWVDSREVMVTDSRFGRARLIFDEAEKRARALVLPEVEAGRVPVMQGFVGRDSAGRTTTLGRGGSDYSATLLGALIQAESVEIWTDVDGIMTADPSLVDGVRRIKQMTFEEAAELAYFGAKVLHPATLLPAVERGIPVLVLNSLRPGEAGTRIVRQGLQGEGWSWIKSIAYKEGLSVLNIKSTRMLMAYGFLATIFEIFNRYETAVDLVSTSEVSVSVTVDNLEHIDQIRSALTEFAEVEVLQNQAIVSLVGENLHRVPGAPAAIFSALEGVKVNLISQGASRINISFVIDESDLPLVINRLHRRFFSGDLDEAVFAVSREAGR